MPQQVNVHLLPELTTPQRLADRTVVVIDVLRASTTIAYALAAGAKEIIPCQEIEEARQLAENRSDDFLLGGERGGIQIEGFDLGNSPTQYTAEKVAGKTIIFTTTNGAKAMAMCRKSRRVLIGSFVTFSAICNELSTADPIEILCAGTNGEVSREDVLFAGAIADQQSRSGAHLNDQAQIATDAWRMVEADLAGRDILSSALERSLGGQNMLALGQQRDIDIAAQIDKFNIVPELDVVAWRITAQ